MNSKLIIDTNVYVSQSTSQAGIILPAYLATIVTGIQIIVKPGGYIEPYVTVLRHTDGKHIAVNVNLCRVVNAGLRKIAMEFTEDELKELKQYYIKSDKLPENHKLFTLAFKLGLVDVCGNFMSKQILDEIFILI